MKSLLNPSYWPSYWLSVARNPAAVIGLVVDLAPIVAIVFWGWGATALVLLYWLENVVIGLSTMPRILIASVGRYGLAGLFGGSFNAAFFSVHYGIFCLAHGGILLELFGAREAMAHADTFTQLIGQMVGAALGFGLHMDWILALIIAFHALVFVREFVLQGGWKAADPEKELFAPYGRVIVLHIGVFVIAGALTALGDPAIGAIALVLARALWGLHMNMRPRPQVAPTPVPA